MKKNFLLMVFFSVLSSLLSCAENDSNFRLRIDAIEGEPSLTDYTPDAQKVNGTVIRQMDGPDGGEYYLFKLDNPFKYKKDKKHLVADYLIVGGRFAGQPLTQKAKQTVVNVAVVTDESLTKDNKLDFNKAFFAAFGEATKIE